MNIGEQEFAAHHVVILLYDFDQKMIYSGTIPDVQRLIRGAQELGV